MSSLAEVVPALALSVFVHAVRTAMLPVGDLLGSGGGKARRLAGLVAATAAGMAATSFIDAGFRFFPADWGLSMLREAPFVVAWLGVPEPGKGSKDAP
jgi:hypothetical protein